MNTQSTQQQNGTRSPAASTPPQAWTQMESQIAHAAHDDPVKGAAQTGRRTPDEPVYKEWPEPPAEPPVLTNPPCATSNYAPEHEAPAQYQPRDPGGSTHPGHSQEDSDPHGGDDGMAHQPHDPTHDGAGQTTVPVTGSAPRQNQRNLTPAARAALCQRLLDYIRTEDPIGYHRENGHVHGTPQFLPWHREFLRRFEQWQRTRLVEAGAFIPLAFWDPADAIPAEFPHAPRNPDIPAMPAPVGLGVDRIGSLDYAQMSAAVEAYHNAVHDAIGGDMRDVMVSPGDPCFWLFHSYVDTLFAQWEALRFGQA